MLRRQARDEERRGTYQWIIFPIARLRRQRQPVLVEPLRLGLIIRAFGFPPEPPRSRPPLILLVQLIQTWRRVQHQNAHWIMDTRATLRVVGCWKENLSSERGGGERLEGRKGQGSSRLDFGPE